MAASAAPRIPLPVLHLQAAGPTTDQVDGEIGLKINGEPVQLHLRVPAGPAPVSRMLPVFQGLTDGLVAWGIAQAEAAGRTLTCRQGCAHCCRQLVPVALSEARHLQQVVARLPAERQATIRARFADALARLTAAGWCDEYAAGGDPVAVSLSYFRFQVACPFLENEACSIYADRPLACREYLVTSPADECTRPADEKVHGLKLPAVTSRAVRGVDYRVYGRMAIIPLLFALDAETEQPEPATLTGPELMQALLQYLR
jgi:Fe-S-cluster containining protein